MHEAYVHKRDEVRQNQPLDNANQAVEVVDKILKDVENAYMRVPWKSYAKTCS